MAERALKREAYDLFKDFIERDVRDSRDNPNVKVCPMNKMLNPSITHLTLPLENVDTPDIRFQQAVMKFKPETYIKPLEQDKGGIIWVAHVPFVVDPVEELSATPPRSKRHGLTRPPSMTRLHFILFAMMLTIVVGVMGTTGAEWRYLAGRGS